MNTNLDECNNSLSSEYKAILSGMDPSSFQFVVGSDEDRYSGVLLPFAHAEYLAAKPRVMLVGQETTDWNTLNGKNTIARVLKAADPKEDGLDLDTIIQEAHTRYDAQYEDPQFLPSVRRGLGGYHKQLAKALNLAVPKGIVWANVSAWDYDAGSPRGRPWQEATEISRVSLELLAASIRTLEPNHIVFVSGPDLDPFVKGLLQVHFGGYQDCESPHRQRKLWVFRSPGLKQATCYRTSHPAYYRDNKFRRAAINLIQKASGMA